MAQRSMTGNGSRADHSSGARGLTEQLQRAGRPAAIVCIQLVAGVAGSLFAIAVMIALRLLWGAPTAPELVAERILPNMSAGQFVSLLIRFQPHPKTGPLGLTLLGQFVLGVLLAPAFLRAGRVAGRTDTWRPSARGWLVAAVTALAMVVVAAALFWPVLPANLFGNSPAQARLITLLSLLLTFAVYTAVTLVVAQALLWAWRPASREHTEAQAGGLPAASALPSQSLYTRREALGAAGATVAVVGIGAFAINRLILEYLARSNLSYEGGGTPAAINSAITPSDDFYVVSKNVLDPTVVVDHWQLELTGLVRQSKTWNFAELRALPSETRAITLECISNEVGARLMSTSVWRGVSLEALLTLAGGAELASRYVVFTSVDGYQTSLPLADLLQARTLIVWEMNAGPLPQRHGYPVRVIVPGRYGEQSAKWVTRIEVIDSEFKGFYQSQGWSAAQLETTSRIDAPVQRVAVGTVPVTGIAFAGIRGIQRVEVSADGGVTWNTATLTPPLSDQSWVFWNWTWHPTTPGTYTLVVRATDGTGTVQTQTKRGTVPNGATGWHRVPVTVG